MREVVTEAQGKAKHRKPLDSLLGEGVIHTSSRRYLYVEYSSLVMYVLVRMINITQVVLEGVVIDHLYVYLSIYIIREGPYCWLSLVYRHHTWCSITVTPDDSKHIR